MTRIQFGYRAPEGWAEAFGHLPGAAAMISKESALRRQSQIEQEKESRRHKFLLYITRRNRDAVEMARAPERRKAEALAREAQQKKLEVRYAAGLPLDAPPGLLQAVILKHVAEKMPVREIAVKVGRSRGRVYQLLAKYAREAAAAERRERRKPRSATIELTPAGVGVWHEWTPEQQYREIFG